MGKVSGVGIFFIVLFVVLILAYVGWVLFSRMRAQRLGLPPPGWLPFKVGGNSNSGGGGGGSSFPAPAPGGIVGWVNDKVRSLKNRRYAAGAYESTTYNAGAGAGAGGGGNMPRGRGNRALDPDEAWDSRVGNESDMYGPGGYYEEQELGLHPPTSYGGSGYVGGAEPDTRGRTRSRDGEERLHYNPASTTTSSNKPKTSNPFGDEAETSDLSSLRGVSPRPIDTTSHLQLKTQQQQYHSKNKASKGSLDESPTERRSMFRENM